MCKILILFAPGEFVFSCSHKFVEAYFHIIKGRSHYFWLNLDPNKREKEQVFLHSFTNSARSISVPALIHVQRMYTFLAGISQLCTSLTARYRS